MTYIIVTRRGEVIGKPFETYSEAFDVATRLYGNHVQDWIRRNLRIEENRQVN